MIGLVFEHVYPLMPALSDFLRPPVCLSPKCLLLRNGRSLAGRIDAPSMQGKFVAQGLGYFEQPDGILLIIRIAPVMFSSMESIWIAKRYLSKKLLATRRKDARHLA